MKMYRHFAFCKYMTFCLFLHCNIHFIQEMTQMLFHINENYHFLLMCNFFNLAHFPLPFLMSFCSFLAGMDIAF